MGGATAKFNTRETYLEGATAKFNTRETQKFRGFFEPRNLVPAKFSTFKVVKLCFKLTCVISNILYISAAVSALALQLESSDSTDIDFETADADSEM